MKLSSLLFLLPLTLLTNCGSPDENSDASNIPQINPSKKIKQEKYQIFSFNENDSLSEEIVETLFDSSGNITLQTNYDGMYVRFSGKSFEYVDGKLVSSNFLESFIYNETDTLLYNSAGVISQQVKEVTNNHIPLRRLSTWFLRGKPSLKLEENLLENKINWRDTFQWSPDLKRVEKTGFDGAGKVAFYSTSLFNEKGDELEYKRFSVEKTLLNESSHIYDSTGKLLEYRESPKGKPISIEKYSYNDKGKKIRLDCFEGGTLPTRSYVYTYNENDDLILTIRMDGNGRVNRKTFYTYQYY